MRKDLTDDRPGTVRPARPGDVPHILRLIRGLAVYEREPDAVRNTEESLHRHLFAEHPAVFCHVVEDAVGDAGQDTRVVGMALWFLNYSTWEGTHGIWLEDLYVDPAVRGRGHGKRLLLHLAGLCAERGYARLEWTVLDWNEPSIGFYRALGAVPMDEWTTYRLTGDALVRAAAPDAGPDTRIGGESGGGNSSGTEHAAGGVVR